MAVDTHSTLTQASASSIKAPVADPMHRAETVSLPQREEPQRFASTSRHTAAADRLAKIHRSAAVAPAVAAAIGAEIEQRAASSRSIGSPVRLSLSKQPESTASQSSGNDSAERAALLDWAAQQRRANVRTRASVPVPGDIDWNAHMTQRRITDNPAAFQTGRAQQ